jgi:hypothetical protein
MDGMDGSTHRRIEVSPSGRPMRPVGRDERIHAIRGSSHSVRPDSGQDEGNEWVTDIRALLGAIWPGTPCVGILTGR